MATGERNAKRRVPKVRMAQPAGRPIQLRYKHPDTGREVRISTGTRDEGEAESQRVELQAQLQLGMLPTRLAKVTGPEMGWPEFREEYRSIRLPMLRRKTALDVESRLDIAERIIKPRMLKDMANPENLQRLQASLLAGAHSRFQRPRSEMTVRGYMRAVLAAINWGKSMGWLTRPVEFEVLRVDDDDHMKGRPLTDREVQLMLERTPVVVGKIAAASWRYTLRGILASGLRLTELMNMSWDLPQTIRPRWDAGRRPVLFFPAYLQKNDKSQEIPLCPWLAELLEETPAEMRTGWVFEPMTLQVKLGRKAVSDRLKSDRVGDVIGRIGREAGIIVDEGNPRTGAPVKYASAHDLRRTFGQRLADSSLPPEQARRLMRHADIRTTERYYQRVNVERDAEKIWAALGRQHELGYRVGRDSSTSENA